MVKKTRPVLRVSLFHMCISTYNSNYKDLSFSGFFSGYNKDWLRAVGR
jgi:hypothetical protein